MLFLSVVQVEENLSKTSLFIYWHVDKMEEFMLDFYTYEYSRNLSIVDNKDDDNDEENYQAIMIKSKETDSQEVETESQLSKNGFANRWRGHISRPDYTRLIKL